jgi:hypothetical protein
MRAMLDERHADRRELSDLMATKPQFGLALIGSELMTATAARIRVVINDLVDLILGLQFATGTLMPGLAASLPRSPFSAHQFLRFQAGFGPPLRP